mmetsp:Transcript_27738/g.36093  ORF Transcript_27738/g.36093 Transcript_27738/m.36093 type:complete len:527 (+) Transcript_27738:172-1752(+)
MGNNNSNDVPTGENDMDMQDPMSPRAKKKEIVEKPVKLQDIEKNIQLVAKAVSKSQSRLILRALRYNTPIRKRITPSVLSQAVSKLVPDSAEYKAALLKIVETLPTASDPPVDMETEDKKDDKKEDRAKDKAVTPSKSTDAAVPEPGLLPEVEVYLSTLVLTTVLRYPEFATAAAELAASLVDRVKEINRRSVDALSAKVYFYFVQAYTNLGKLGEIRPVLLSLHRSCCLRHDEMGQAVLLNALLRSLLNDDLVDAADKLISKTNFPESISNNQLCRYLYYTGRVRAIQLDYSDAAAALGQALRKSPQGAKVALGFRIAVQQLRCIVQLLMGEIPERSDFEQTGMRKALKPYLELTTAVRAGNLKEFQRVASEHESTFRKDRTAMLIKRLSHNVIKIGLRKINLSYSRISLEDIAARLHLGDSKTAEFVCAKAIKDGVIEAKINPEKKWLESQDLVDVYATTEPQQAFHKRITFCLDVHNEAVKAMRYPPNAYKKVLESNKIEQDKTEEEIAKEIEEELDDDDADF